MNKTNYHKLCAKSVSGQITLDEKQILENWINTSPANNAYYNEISRAWNLSEPPVMQQIIDVDEGWFRVEQSLEFGSKTENIKTPGSTFQNLKNLIGRLIQPHYRPAVYSFATVLILAVGFILLRDQFLSTGLQEIVTFNKQKMQITLSDGSQIHLNCGSSIRFHKDFSDTVRQVILLGEAFFRVSHDERPFVVITENASTRVLGTQFNVHARNTRTRVIVQEGRVKLSSIQETYGNVILSKGQMSQVAGNVSPDPPEDVNVEHLLGWLKDRLVFEKTPLGEILDELERYYDISVKSMDPELDQKTITATFEDESIETVLASLCLTLNAKFEYDEDIYRIINKP